MIALGITVLAVGVVAALGFASEGHLITATIFVIAGIVGGITIIAHERDAQRRHEEKVCIAAGGTPDRYGRYGYSVDCHYPKELS